MQFLSQLLIPMKPVEMSEDQREFAGLIHLAVELSTLLLIPDLDGRHGIGVDDDQNQRLGAERGAVAVPTF